MRGPTPKTSLVTDWILGFVMSFAWPFPRSYFDSMVRKDGQKNATLQKPGS